MERVHTFLGLIGLTIFVVLIIALAAAVTAAVVRISPAEKKQQGS
jgi:hypothetical protein